MFKRFVAPALALSVIVSSATARADETPRRPINPKQRTGIILTSVGGTLLLTAPLVILASAVAIQANPYGYAGFGPVILGAMGGGIIGAGMLVPGIVMTATCRQPTWNDTRPPPVATHALTIPLIRGTF
jgi:hypothetical protein